MGILSNAKRRLGYFILDHIVTQEVISSWKSGYIEDPLPDVGIPPMQTIPDPAERHTDRIDANAVNAAVKAQNIKVVRGRALDVPADKVAPGKLAPWYWDRVNRVIDEDTVEMSAINLQEELRRRLDEGLFLRNP